MIMRRRRSSLRASPANFRGIQLRERMSVLSASCFISLSPQTAAQTHAPPRFEKYPNRSRRICFPPWGPQLTNDM
jgi:hypothetical protein